MEAIVSVGVLRDGVSWLVLLGDCVIPWLTVSGVDDEEALSNAIAFLEQHARVVRISDPSSRN